MAGGASTAVYDIFLNMEFGPAAAAGTSTAQAWLDHHSRSLGFFTDGKFVDLADRRRRSLADSKGGVVCNLLCAEDEDVSRCAQSAASGFESWSSLTCHQRAEVLLRSVGVVELHGRCLCELCELCETSCTPSSLVRQLQYYSSWARLRDSLLSGWRPLGVVLVVTSDDCSLCSLVLKVLPALAMGNSVIVVPGRSTAPPALLLAQLFTAAGLPAGALSVLTGSDVMLGATVARDPVVRYLTFVGNQQDGVEVCKASAGTGIPVSVSPGAASMCPFIVFESADVDSAVDEVMETAFRKKKKEVHWWLCVQESVLDRVVARLRRRVAGMESVVLPSDADRALVDAEVAEAGRGGATLIQARPAPPSGSRYPPTVLCGLAPSSPSVRRPSPGPLLPLVTFRSDAEAAAVVNHSPHGLASSVWTEDLTLALETADALSIGTVWVNSSWVSDPCLPTSAPKGNATCTDGGQEGLYQFLHPSSSSPPLRSSPVSVDYSQFGTEESPAAVVPGASEPAGTTKYHLQLVSGQMCRSLSGGSVAVQPPGGGAVLGFCPDGGRKDVRNAVEAAVKVQASWKRKSPSARAQALYSLAKGLDAQKQDVSASIVAQTGASPDAAKEEVQLSVARLGVWAAYCDKIQGGPLPMPQSGLAVSSPEALGVIGVVLPDRSPLLSMVTVLGAAVSTGNAVVMVPSQKYPLPALTFIRVLRSSGLPGGLVNVITGSRDQLTVALANHSVIKAIWYWGSAEGCQYLQYTCTTPLKTLWLFHQNDKKDEEGMDWTGSHPSLLEEMWRKAVQWKSVWAPTA